jgi:hypothetical protein
MCLKQQVSVYRDEADYVRAKLYEKTAPNVQSVVASDAGGDFFGLPINLKDRSSGAAAAKPAPKPAPPPTDPTKKGGTAP